MSNRSSAIERWQAPSFEADTMVAQPVDLVQLEEQARIKGYELGKWEGMEKSWSDVQQMVKRLSTLAEEMTYSFRSLDQLVAKELTQLAMSAARQIVRRELMTNSSVVMDVVTDALETLSNLTGDVEIYINPDDLELVTKVAEEKLEGKSWKMIMDETMLPGGCRIKTATSFIDASVENQMDRVFAALSENAENLMDI